MSPDLDSWLGNAFPLSDWRDDHDRGVDTAQLIAEKPTSIEVRRTVGGNSTTLSAQTVRLEPMGGDRQVQDSAGTTHMIDAYALGHKGHPTITDTDLQAGDRFSDDDGVAYEVIAIAPGLTDGLQVYLQVRA